MNPHIKEMHDTHEASQLAPFFVLLQEATLRIARGETPIAPDELLGSLTRLLWRQTTDRRQYIADAAGAIEAARFDLEAERLSGQRVVARVLPESGVRFES